MQLRNHLTVKSSLTLVNLLVAGLILYLIGNLVWHDGNQRQQMRYLQSYTSLANSGILLQHSLDAEARAIQPLILQSKEAEQQQLADLELTVSRTNESFGSLIDNLGSIKDLGQEGLFENWFYQNNPSKKVAAEHLNHFKERNMTLETYRDFTIAEVQNPADRRNTELESLLPLYLPLTVKDLGQTLAGLTYLPDREANSVNLYQSLLLANWDLFNDIAELDLTLSQQLVDTDQELEVNLFQIQALENQIDFGWQNLERSTDKLASTEKLLAAVEHAKKVYAHDHNVFSRRIKAAIEMGYDQNTTPQKWRESVNAVRDAQMMVSDIAMNHLGAISNQLLDSASRKFRRGCLLLLICIAISALLIISGRILKRQASTDALTGLANRRTFESELVNHSSAQDLTNNRQMVIFLGLDRFKHINESHGHLVGDLVLMEVAKRLRALAGEDSMIARLGSNEFAIYKKLYDAKFDPLAYTEDLLEKINKELSINCTKIRPGIRAGYAIAPDDSAAGTQLLNNADIAKYRSSNLEGSRTAYRFNSTMGESHHTRRRLENSLHDALRKQQFQIHYQPKVDTKDGTVRGVEALLRWQHPKLGGVSPAVFIPIAEDLGLLGTIGGWVVKRACQDIAALHKQGLAGLGLAVNISAQQFTDDSFCDKMLDVLEATGFDPRLLELEVTESIVMHDISRVTETLSYLREQGISIAIDDFGTGYSCLAHLRDLPLDTLKIDRAFVQTIGESADDKEQSMVNSIVQLGALFKLKTVAEGIETDVQLERMSQLGVDQIQGFYYSRPVPLDELPAVVTEIDRNSIQGLDEDISSSDDLYGKAA